MYSSCSPAAAPAGRGPAAAEKATQKPMTAMPRTALQVRTARKVPRITRTQATGSSLTITAARCRPVPGIRERPARDTAPKRA